MEKSVETRPTVVFASRLHASRIGKPLCVAAAVAALFTGSPARADDIADLKAQMKVLSDKLEALERAQIQSQSASAQAPAQSAVSSARRNASMTVYGLVDASIYTHRSNGKVTYGVNSSAITSSHLGFHGERDIGRGLTGFLNFRENVNILTGGTGSGLTGATTTGFNNFNALANVGVSSPYGTVTLGRQPTPTFSTSVAVDSFQIASLGIAQQYGMANLTNLVSPLTGLTVPATTNTQGGAAFTSTYVGGLSYTTPVVAGFQGKALVTLGNGIIGAGYSNNSLWEASISYRNGPLDANYAHNSIKGRQTANATTGVFAPVPSLTRTNIFGAGYTVSGVRISASYFKTTYDPALRNPTPTTGIHDNSAWSAGALATTGPWKYGVEYTAGTDLINTANKDRMLSFLGRYALDESAEVYGMLGFVRNSGNASMQPIWSAANLVCTPASPANALSSCGKSDTTLVLGYKQSF